VRISLSAAELRRAQIEVQAYYRFRQLNQELPEMNEKMPAPPR